LKSKHSKHSNSKRLILKFFFGTYAIVLLIPFIDLASISELINRIRNRFKTTPKIPEDNQRTEAQLPEGGSMVSVELALNSRCTSDYDDDSNLSHWGLFDNKHKLSKNQLSKIGSLLNIPRFTKSRLEVRRDNNFFMFVVNNQQKETEKGWSMVESGMQQQALCLVCATLGVGTVFRGMGKNGKLLSNNTNGIIRIKLDAMKPSYNGVYWTESSPSGRRRWLPGNLPEPVRDGSFPLLNALSGLKTEKTGRNIADDHAIGQLLWAARGRTPHRYNSSKEWGMTVPTVQGLQDVTRVFYYADGKLFKYVNWEKKRPTHHMEKVGVVNSFLSVFFDHFSPQYNGFIILTKNENFYRALWEIGYELLNILLQASAWNLNYKSVLLNNDQKKYLQNTEIKDAVALVAVRKTAVV